MTGLIAQVEAFALTLLLGMLAAVLIHYYQLSIRVMNIGRYTLYLLDILFWIMMLILIFAGILAINQGELRIYVFIGLVLGALVYLRCLAPRTSKAIHSAALHTARNISRLSAAIKIPLLFLHTRWQLFKQSKKKPPPSREE